MTPPDQKRQTPLADLPVETEIFINADGSVTFADLQEALIGIARMLSPDETLNCDLPDRVDPPSTAPVQDVEA